MKVTYTSSNGKSYTLTSSMRMRLKTANFHDFAWKPDVTARRYGERVNLWGKEAGKYEATIAFRGTHAQRRVKIDEFHSSIERDVFYNTPGTLTWGGWYIYCFLSSSRLYTADFDIATTCNDVEIYCPNPFWIAEQSISIAPVQETVLKDTDKQYNTHYGYPYSYQVASNTSRRVVVDHYAPCDFKAVLHGPQDNANITISNAHVLVEHAIPAGAYMVIDTRQSTPADKHCYLVEADGTETNCFNFRDPTTTLLQKIEPGTITVTYNRQSQLDLTIYRERSEPSWN